VELPANQERHIASRYKKCCNAMAGNARESAMASVKFLRKQAERCAHLAEWTNDEDSRQRYEELQRKYCYLADLEEQETVEPSGKH
jgi:hypothetical protein